MSIGENIKARREAAGMTQARLAEAVGVSVPMICQIERGTKVPSLPLGAQIAACVGCKLEDLIEKEVNP